VEKYDQYQKIKNRVEMLVGKLKLYIVLIVYNEFLKILYIITTTEKIIAKRLVRLFKNNI